MSDAIMLQIFQGVNFINGLNLEQAEFAIKAIASVHALSLAMKFKEKIDLNEKYSVS
jgi:Ecdysteroid kinase-like family